MVWIEMSKDEKHGGYEWGFGQCVWAPTKKSNSNSSWIFWKNILSVEVDDVILHLKNDGKEPKFVGFSQVRTAGEITSERPPYPGIWSYSPTFYRAFLKNFAPFPNPISLQNVFAEQEVALNNYLDNLNRIPKNVFFTKQNKQFQCLNGAYFSLADDALLDIIFSTDIFGALMVSDNNIPDYTETNEIWRKVKQRIGQSTFARNVKSNFEYKCCFPGCNISDKRYLVASHIDRWADNPEERGSTSNGLCFCVLHDKAFELGEFSLNSDYEIIANVKGPHEYSSVFKQYIYPKLGKPITDGIIMPSLFSLREHQKRHNF